MTLAFILLFLIGVIGLMFIRGASILNERYDCPPDIDPITGERR